MAHLGLVGACGGDDGGGGEGTGSDGGDGTGGDGSDDGGTDGGDDGGTGTGGDDGGTGTDGGDDGGTGTGSGDDGSTTGGGIPADAFRFTDMYVRDPHFFVVPLVGCEDITDNGILGSASINEQFNESIDTDGDDPPDGLLDLNFLLLFRPLDQAADSGDVDFAVGECVVPADATTCDLAEGASLNPTTYDNTTDGTCLEPDPAELSSQNYDPAPVATTSPCFLAGPLTLDLELGDFLLPLQDAEIAAQYVGDPAENLVEGLIRGFLTEADADATALPPDLPLVGDSPISALLPGGTDNCAGHDDRDDNGGTSGWWFYVEFTAMAVPYTGP
jgi:hypothetical protein